MPGRPPAPCDPSMPDTPHEHQLPPFSRRLNGWFMFYVRRYLRRHFHALRLLKSEPPLADHPDLGGEPVIIYTNHPSWWDPLILLSIGEILYPGRLSYGPIDSRALGKYKFMERIGFIGIEMGTWRGAARFLRMARAAGERGDVIFWVTSQGEFADPRQRPVQIRPGIGHAVENATRGIVVPMAIEYPFWNERLPEVLAAFGSAIRIADAPRRTAQEWTDFLAQSLGETQDRLATAALARQPNAFRTLMRGRVGVGGVYDLVRRIGGALRGESFDVSHGGREST